MANPYIREIPNRHHSLTHMGNIKDTFPGMRFGKETLKELDNLIFLLLVKAVDRARTNRRTTVMRHDL